MKQKIISTHAHLLGFYLHDCYFAPYVPDLETQTHTSFLAVCHRRLRQNWKTEQITLSTIHYTSTTTFSSAFITNNHYNR